MIIISGVYVCIMVLSALSWAWKDEEYERFNCAEPEQEKVQDLKDGLAARL